MSKEDIKFKNDIVTRYKNITIEFDDVNAYIIGKIIVTLYNKLIYFPTFSKFMIDQDNTLGITTPNILNILKHVPIQYLFSDYLEKFTIIENKMNNYYCGIYYDIIENDKKKIYTLSDLTCFAFDEKKIEFTTPPKYSNKHFVCETRNVKRESRSKSILFSTDAKVNPNIQKILIEKFKYTTDSFNFSYDNGEILTNDYGKQYTKVFDMFGLKKNNLYEIKIFINLFNDINDNVYYNYILFILDIIEKLFEYKINNISYEKKSCDEERRKFMIDNDNINYEVIEIDNEIDITIFSAISELNNGPVSTTKQFLKPKDIEYDMNIVISLFKQIMYKIKDSVKNNIK
jgi:hypothetical protein